MTGAGWIAALAALFLWWFSTGAILLVVRLADRRGARARQAAVIWSLPLLGLGLWGYLATLDQATPAGAYLSFLAALAIWGWIELSFLVGVITGPNRRECPGLVPEWERFVRAWGTVAYHEFLLAGALLTLWLIGRDAENHVGLSTFVLLFFARVSAKLNLFLGVPATKAELLPSPLSHLPGHFRVAPLNWLFPLSITALSAAAATWFGRLAGAETAFDTVAFALIGSITALALLEHWLMVLPLPDEKLWRWMLPDPRPIAPHDTTEDAHGL